MDIGNACATPPPIVWIVCDGEKADAFLEVAMTADLMVEVVDHGNVECRRASLDPISAELIAMAVVDGLDCVSQIVQNSRECVEPPSFATILFP